MRCTAFADDSKEAFMQTKKSIQKRMSTETMVLGAIMTALVIILQLLGSFTAFFGPFSTAVALIPIAIGAILCGPAIGAWLGFVFGVVVIASGGAALFLAFDIPGTIVTVMVKGTACGFAAGWVYKLLKKWNGIVAAFAAAIVCPLVNTGLFLLGCAIFFLDDAVGIATAVASPDAGMALFIGFAMANFLIEIATNTLLSPIFVRLLKIKKKV